MIWVVRMIVEFSNFMTIKNMPPCEQKIFTAYLGKGKIFFAFKLAFLHKHIRKIKHAFSGKA